jgi:very-short-patch-repair endonuclease
MRERVAPTKRGFARGMRVQATDAEMRLWLHLRNGRWPD